MMLKVHMMPPLPRMTNGGIRRVAEALYRYLPEYGVEIVPELDDAEVTVGHVDQITRKAGAPFISHNHGLYWADYEFPSWAERVNRGIVEALTQAQAITAPSEWVKRAISRGLYQDVTVLYHGVEPDEWAYAGEREPYVLWNKARTDAVSDPRDMQQLAAQHPDISFVSTFGTPTSNVKIIGAQDARAMQDWVQRASLYLCTARETFGIGTLEALAAGVPVIGWNYGGQKEIIRQGETGYLAAEGDFAELGACLRRGLQERGRLSDAGVADVRARWGWRRQVKAYADLYKSTAAWHYAPRPKVSVIIPCHNLARFLADAVRSVQQQTFQNFECLIVDDSSTDETPQVARAFVAEDVRFRYLRTHYNMKLPAVRNYGAQHAFGKYLLYLDADDQLTPDALALQAYALDTDPTIHIAYGMLDLVDERGSNRRRNPFPATFDWFRQISHLNQIPTAAMLRRAVVEQTGGWRTRMTRAEDAEFWSRVTSMGFRAAKVTDETTLLYRLREDSKGAVEQRTYTDHDGNWLEHMAWRNADTSAEGLQYVRRVPQGVKYPELVPFGAQGTLKSFWSIYHRETPIVVVLIYTTAETTPDQLYDSVDSIVGQDIDAWDVYVIGKRMKGLPFVRFVESLEVLDNVHAAAFYEMQAGDMLPSDELRTVLQNQYGTQLSPGVRISANGHVAEKVTA